MEYAFDKRNVRWMNLFNFLSFLHSISYANETITITKTYQILPTILDDSVTYYDMGVSAANMLYESCNIPGEDNSKAECSYVAMLEQLTKDRNNDREMINDLKEEIKGATDKLKGNVTCDPDFHVTLLIFWVVVQDSMLNSIKKYYSCLMKDFNWSSRLFCSMQSFLWQSLAKICQ